MGRIEGKVAIITGANLLNGIGFASAKAFVREGGAVVVTGRNGQAAQERAEELSKGGGKAIGLSQDVRSESGWEEVMAATLKAFGKLDILVNNAGNTIIAPIEEITLAQWEEQISVKLTSTFLGCRVAIKQMRAQNQGGSIVNVASTSGIIGVRRVPAYCASNGGIRMLSKSLALDCAPQNIRVNSVHPGPVRTDLFIKSSETDPELAKAIIATIPLGHWGAPEDLGALILFLASDEAKFITGAEYIADGGRTTH